MRSGPRHRRLPGDAPPRRWPTPRASHRAAAGHGFRAPCGDRPARRPAESARSPGHRLGRLPRLAMRHQLLAHADAQRLLGRHLAAGEDDLHRAALSHQPRQTHRAAIEQGDAPAAAVDAEVGALGHHADVAPQRELHAARHRGAFHRRDHGLRQLQPRRPQRPSRRRVGAHRKRQAAHDVLVEALAVRQRARVLEVPAGAEGAALAPQHRDARLRIAVEGLQLLDQRVGAVRVHRVARFVEAAVDHGPHRTILLGSHGHWRLLLKCLLS